MKANAPEKIYMTPSFGEPDNVLLASFSKSHLNFHRDIEYIRADVFIERACDFIRKIVDIPHNIECEDGQPLVDDYIKYAEERLKAAEKVVNDFKNYMKGG